MSALHTCDIGLLGRHLWSRFCSRNSDGDLQWLAADIMSARCSLSAGKLDVRLCGIDHVLKPESLVGLATADGVVVTDYSLTLRSLLLSAAGPMLGQKPARDAMAAADAVRLATLRFFAGGAVGGAVVDSGRFYISPHWLPGLLPNPVAATSASYSDPNSRMLAYLAVAVTDVEKDDVQKALRLAADPYFALLAVTGHTPFTTTSLEPAMSYRELDDWKPVFVRNGDDPHPVRRPGTFVPSSDYTDLRSDALEGISGAGQLLQALQMPRVLAMPSILHRVVFDGAQAWVTGTDYDYAVDGITSPLVVAILQGQEGYKNGWLQELRGWPTTAAISTALAVSPLAYCRMAAQFRPDAMRSQQAYITLTAERRAWIRSDPGVAESAAWIADTPSDRISEVWVEAASPGLYAQLASI